LQVPDVAAAVQVALLIVLHSKALPIFWS